MRHRPRAAGGTKRRGPLCDAVHGGCLDAGSHCQRRVSVQPCSFHMRNRDLCGYRASCSLRWCVQPCSHARGARDDTGEKISDPRSDLRPLRDRFPILCMPEPRYLHAACTPHTRHAHLPQLGLQRLDELPCLAGLKHALLIYAPVGIDPLDDCV